MNSYTALASTTPLVDTHGIQVPSADTPPAAFSATDSLANTNSWTVAVPMESVRRSTPGPKILSPVDDRTLARKPALENAATRVLALNGDGGMPSPGPVEGSSSPSTLVDSLAGESGSVYKAACRTITFPVPDKEAGLSLQGKHFKLTGKVMQIRDAGSDHYWQGYPGGLMPETPLLVAVTNDGYGN